MSISSITYQPSQQFCQINNPQSICKDQTNALQIIRDHLKQEALQIKNIKHKQAHAKQIQNVQNNQLILQDDFFKKIYDQIVKLIFEYYQQMQLSIHTLFLALQLSQHQYFKSIIKKELLQIQDTIQNKKISPFESINYLINSQNNQTKCKQLFKNTIVQIYSISLLYVTHKIVDDLEYKYSSNVWIQHLKLQIITKNDIKTAQINICNSFKFDLFHQNVFTLTVQITQQIKSKKTQLIYFVHYILQLYLNSYLLKFIGNQNKKKRLILLLAAVKLGCHFLCPKNWSDNILRNHQICVNQLQTNCRKLFALMLNKTKNKQIHKKYQLPRYKSISKLKISQQKKSNQLDQSQKP